MCVCQIEGPGGTFPPHSRAAVPPRRTPSGASRGALCCRGGGGKGGPAALPPSRPVGRGVGAAGQRPPFLRAACLPAAPGAPTAAGRRLLPAPPGPAAAGPAAAAPSPDVPTASRKTESRPPSQKPKRKKKCSRSLPASNQRDTSLLEHALRAPSVLGLFGQIKNGRNASPFPAAGLLGDLPLFPPGGGGGKWQKRPVQLRHRSVCGQGRGDGTRPVRALWGWWLK